MCQKNTHLTKHISVHSFYSVSENGFFLNVEEERFFLCATQACICNKRRVFLKFFKKIFVRKYCQVSFFCFFSPYPALNVCRLVCFKDGTGVTEAVNIHSILHVELCAILKSWVDQNYIGAQP